MKEQTVPVSLELLAQACHAMDKRKAPNTFDEFQRMIKAGLAAANSPKAGEPGLDIDALEALARDARDIIKRALENHVLDNFCHGLKEDAREFIESHDAAFKESSPKAPALPPIDPKLDNLQHNYSIEVIILDALGDYSIGFYGHVNKKWMNNYEAGVKAVEWWPLPIPGTGAKVPLEVTP